MKRFGIATLMTIILYMAIGLGALVKARHPWIWQSTIYALTAFFMTMSALLAFVRRGREKMAWTGFAVFGRAYLLVLEFEDWSVALRTPLVTAKLQQHRRDHELGLGLLGAVGLVVAHNVADPATLAVIATARREREETQDF